MEAGEGNREGVGREALELGPLPGGHHGLSREQIHDSQRERLLAAVAREVGTRGYQATTITEIVKIASVSTRDFYEIFENKEECFLAALAVVRDHLVDLVGTAVAPEPDWPNQVVAATRALLEFFAAEPDLARLCLVESISATPASALQFREAVRACIPGMELGRSELTDPDSVLPGTESSLIGGAISLAGRAVVAGEPEKLPDLLPDLTVFILSPYLGPAGAARFASGLRA